MLAFTRLTISAQVTKAYTPDLKACAEARLGARGVQTLSYNFAYAQVVRGFPECCTELCKLSVFAL